MKSLKTERCKIISHRGMVKENIKENTLEAFQQAIKLGADMIETDVRSMKDGTLVCSHDPEWNGQRLSQMTYDDWCQQTMSEEGWRPPLLSEAMELCEGVIPVNLEVKEKALEEKILREIPASFLKKDLLISSFEDEVIQKIKDKANSIRTALVVGRSILSSSTKKFSYWKDFYPENRLKKAKADAVCPHFRLANKSFVHRLHQHGYNVYVWTVNSEEKIKKTVETGADGLFTDKVELVLKIVR